MRLARIFSALIVIVTVLIAKVPNKNCHCFDKNKSQKQECPFGKLRTAVSSLTVTNDFVLSALQVTAYELEELRHKTSYTDTFFIPNNARDPPVNA